jgi:hypothetical protein
VTKLDMFGPPADPKQNREEARPDGVPYEAVVECQVCGMDVPEQVYYPTEKVLLWECPEGHRSFIEGFKVF